ncbi:DNA replication protein DnaC [Peptococcaceae bacterium CEB3]|nr:DNA replication protein DnaC [Peptococcaceae bacterium CEB3]
MCEDCGKLVKPILVEFLPALGGSRYLKGRCTCSVDRHNEIVRRATEYEKQRQVASYFGWSTVGKKFNSKTLEDFEPKSGTSAGLRRAHRFLADAKAGRDIVKGFMLVGPVGVGKSHIAAAIFNQLTKQGKACIFQNVPELLDTIRATYSVTASSSEADLLRVVKQCDILILDDLGAERHREGGNDWATEKLFTVFDYRYRNDLPIIVTTNCQPDILEDLIGKRISSRIREMCDLVAVPGDDYRKQRAGGGKGV